MNPAVTVFDDDRLVRQRRYFGEFSAPRVLEATDAAIGQSPCPRGGVGSGLVNRFDEDHRRSRRSRCGEQPLQVRNHCHRRSRRLPEFAEHAFGATEVVLHVDDDHGALGRNDEFRKRLHSVATVTALVFSEDSPTARQPESIFA